MAKGSRTPSKAVEPRTYIDFPIVGIGASAGGLEALKELLSNMSTDTGMAFVVIQHLDPKHESMSSEILSRHTRMPVKEIIDGMQLEPNHVYVIPPNCNLGISQGALKILPRTETRGQHMPLDFFFQELARLQKTRAIGIVLSGTASDGTQGLRAIKAEGGITLVQDPQSAKYDGMPRSAIASGTVDLINNPAGIAAELARIAKHPYVIPQGNEPDQEPRSKDNALFKVFSLLRGTTKIDFSHYKTSTIQRRIARRMLLKKSDNLDKYSKYLENNPDEIEALFADILIHVTGFFRDKKAFETLKTRILPKYMKNRNPNLPFRIWVPGCSTGEEVYSLAMIFIEFLDESKDYSNIRIPLSIFGTDISEQALQKARAAIYPESITQDVSKERLRKFFEKADGGGYRIAKWLRDSCLFSRHDVTRDPPFAKVDLISCRNVLIYFDSELQRSVLPIFHYALNPKGILILGKSETIGGFSNLFSLTDKTNKFYSKNPLTTPLKIQLPLSHFSVERLESNRKLSESLPGRIDVRRELERIALAEYVPPCVVINDAFEILQSMGSTAPFLGLSPGHPSLNLLRMAHPELIPDLRAAVQVARKANAPVFKENLCIREGSKLRELAVRVVPIPTQSQSNERYFAVFFEETRGLGRQQGAEGSESYSLLPKTRTKTGKESKQNRDKPSLSEKHHLEVQRKLAANQEYQQSLIEEYKTSQEELVSSNEELQSTNEELQSTNEELETAKEELQSANEELTTVNDEMQTRNMEMIHLNNDLTNLLASVDIPIVMVGPDGRIRRFTPKAGKALKLIATDVGRPIGDIRPNIHAPDLDQLVSEVMETMIIREVETQDNHGFWYHLQVRPYRTAENKIDGAVIALLDIDSLKRNEEALRKSAEDLKRARDDATTIIESQPIPLLVIDSQQRVKLANEIFYDTFQVARAETVGKLVSELGGTQWNVPHLKILIEKALNQGIKFEKFEVDHNFPRIGQRVMLLSCRKVQLAGSGEIAALLAIEDVTGRFSVERALKDSEEKYRSLITNAHDGIVIVNEEGKIEFTNPQIEKMFGYTSQELLNQTVEVLLPDRARRAHVSHRAQYSSNPTAREMGTGLDLYGKRKDGTEFPVDISLSPVQVHTGTFVTAIVRDVSERKEVEKVRARLLEKEKKANLIKDEFLATLSHELRTPLTTILSWSQMLRTGKLNIEKTRRGIEILEQSAKAQGQLIDDLLDISRIQAGKLSLTIQKIDPRSIVSAAIDSTRNLAEAKSIQIETQIDPSIHEIFVDPARLQQILWNLITNAIKFSSLGGMIWIKLDRCTPASGEKIRIQVLDNGKGIKPEFIPVIFERFTQMDSTTTRKYGGLGLGLSIVKKLVEMHHGTVEVASHGDDQGATFTVLLPAVPPSQITTDENQREYQTTDQTKSEVSLHGLKILLVDDEENAREVFSIMLQSFGAEVKTAESARKALEVLENFKPDVLVSDIAMPVEDGYSLIEKIRAMKSKLGQTPALALTAYAGRDDIQRAHLAGFQIHMSKPVDANKLALAISRLVRRG